MTRSTDYQAPACALKTRREFLAAIGAGAAVSVTGPWGLSMWGNVPAATLSAAPSGVYGHVALGRTLVVVEMGGGNDGLNMVVPHQSSRYYDLRGDLAITTPIDLDGEIGFHPSLETLASMYDRGDVAVVEGVGYPNPDLSHFASMNTWWTAATNGRTGWLGRYLDGATDESSGPLPAVTIGRGPTPALLAERTFQVVIQDMSGLVPTIPAWVDDPTELMAMWGSMVPPELDRSGALGAVDAAIAGTIEAAGTINSILAVLSDDTTAPSPSRRVELVDYLTIAAGLVTSESPPRVIYVHGWGDFDTHESHASRHDELLRQLDGGVGAFFATLDAAGAADRAIVMTTSEFGRRPAFNGSGTDHGTASSLLVVGRAAAGGRHGVPVDLSRLDPRGNPTHTVDFRSTYAAIVDQWFEADAETVVGPVETLRLVMPQTAADRPV